MDSIKQNHECTWFLCWFFYFSSKLIQILYIFVVEDERLWTWRKLVFSITKLRIDEYEKIWRSQYFKSCRSSVLLLQMKSIFGVDLWIKRKVDWEKENFSFRNFGGAALDFVELKVWEIFEPVKRRSICERINFVKIFLKKIAVNDFFDIFFVFGIFM